MKRKVLTGILILIAVLFVTAASFAIKNAAELHKLGRMPEGLDTDLCFVSSAGGEALSREDPDYVEVKARGYDITSVVATDDLGRTLKNNGREDNGRQVVLFYSLWHDCDNGINIFQDSLDSGTPLVSGQYYWWGKPLFDFYSSKDVWVTRRHIEMFIYAGIDALIIDATNGSAYTAELTKLMRLLHEYNEAGWNAPKVALYTNSDSQKTMLSAYWEIYSLNKYPDTWYMIDGKPLIIGSETDPAIDEFFTFRRAQWPNHTGERVPGGFPWIDFSDDADVYYDTNGKHGVIPVSVAQNSSPNAWFSDNVLYGMTGQSDGSRGRSWHGGKDSITDDSYLYGYNFQEEWDNAIVSDAEIAMVLQWNEWIAGVWQQNSGKLAVYDQMTNEYSRDIEPMSGGFFDNYYMQLVQNVRRFKNTGSKTVSKGSYTIDVNGAFGQWNGAGETYIDMQNATLRRDAISYGPYRLTDTSGRNGMVAAKVTKDSEKIYFYVQTQEDIIIDGEGTWMNLYIDTDRDLLNNWNGYEFRINGIASEGKLRLEKYGVDSFEQASEVSFRIRGNQLMLEIPKAELGISGTQFTVNFKWADSRTELNSFEDFYLYGDTMPYGRFNYAFNAGK